MNNIHIGYGEYDGHRFDGGPGSGNHNHAGIPGKRGGSTSTKGMSHNPNRNYGDFKVSKKPGKGTTLEKYVVDGKLTPERQELHKKIIDSLMDDIPKPEGQPTMTFLGGGPASGKSSITKSSQIETPDEKKTVCIDSDKIKKMIPEYEEAIKKGDSNAANMVHDESSMIAWNALAIAQGEGFNCMMDGTGDGSIKDMKQSIVEAKANGMRVEGKYVTCDTDTAVIRASARANGETEDKGRKVPEIHIRQTHQNVSKILPEIAEDFDKVELYCTDAGSKPVLIAVGGGGKKLKPVDDYLYKRFTDKSTESLPYHFANPKDYNIN